MIGDEEMKIKICGITTEQEIVWLNELGVDYAGFVVFFEKSKRNVSIDRAKELLFHIQDPVTAVAVTVEPSLAQIREMEEAGFDMIQIHGNIDLNDLKEVSIPVWKAFNVKDMKDFACYENCEKITGYVFDAQTPGSGQTFDWSELELLPETDKQIMLAGGLGPDNVADAVRISGDIIDGVDTSSGVENDSGVGKNKGKMERFVDEVRCLQNGG